MCSFARAWIATVLIHTCTGRPNNDVMFTLHIQQLFTQVHYQVGGNAKSLISDNLVTKWWAGLTSFLGSTAQFYLTQCGV